MSGSEVARIREQIELECQAIRRVFDDPAQVASHEIVQHKYDALGAYGDQLAHHVGAQAADVIMCELYARIVG